MKGLILKDLLTLKNQMRNIMIIIIGFIYPDEKLFLYCFCDSFLYCNACHINI